MAITIASVILTVIRRRERVDTAMIANRIAAIPYTVSSSALYAALRRLVSEGKLKRITLKPSKPSDPLYVYTLTGRRA